MADFSQIIQEINEDITTNGVGAITGAKLNEVLRDMIAAVNAAKEDLLPDGAVYGGWAFKNMPPEYGNDPKFYYLADESGTYQYYGNVELDGRYVNMLYLDNGVWASASLWMTSNGMSEELQQYVSNIDLYPKLGFPLFSPYDTYNVNDVVAHNGELYIFVNAHTGAWNANDVALTDLFQQLNGAFSNIFDAISNKADKVTGATVGDFAGLDASGNLTDSGSKASDFATAAQGTKADTAYQMPTGGIPASDLASAVQTSLGKADTAVQQVTVGTTTTGNAGTNASVTNSGTATAPVLNFTIPQGEDGNQGPAGADAVNPFKGWWPDFATLKAEIEATAGDYAYVMPASPTDPVKIYEYDETATTDNYWADSGRTFNPSNNQEFATGEELNLTGITNHIMVASKRLIESGAVYTAFNTLVQLLRKAAYVEDDAEDILDVLESLISGVDIPITGITIVGDASVVGSAVYVATLDPADTTERDILWSITSGSEYATVLSDGTLIALNNGSVVLKCASAFNPSVYDTKTISVSDSATHIMPLTSDTADTVGSLTPAKSAYTAISSDGMQITSNSNEGLSYAYSADFKTFIFDLKYAKSATIWQYIFGNWGGGTISNLGFAIKQNTNEVWYTTDSGDYSANKTLSENTWHRIGIQIISATSASLWIDGEKIITPTFTSRTITYYIFGNNWRFQAVNGTRAIGGYFKNLKIYDQVLSDDLMTVKTQIS